MTRFLRFIEQSTEKNPSAICMLIAVATLSVDFATGRDIRFPLLYVVPIGLAASDPEVACLLVGMGVRDLSMNPFLATRVCRALRHVTIDQAQTLAREDLSATTTREIQEIVASALSDAKGV